ncbi:hypothetical protein [Couchioplanes caeruleus]|uniref:Flavin reductase n=1 Tax=Couchioplanes caeruleus TaxID=56438 RepID=A0A3N1GGE1_9ACTN|nr:hypothetical protein [Couchioplanes caeruleus]ROP29304.1 hypothetical protein EDD30_2092 [Couchioplanes caeruleus]
MAQPATVTATAHAPHKPSWDCLACGRPWPCDPAREALAADMDFVRLACFMWDALEEAVRDLPPTPATELFQRFLTWIL